MSGLWTRRCIALRRMRTIEIGLNLTIMAAVAYLLWNDAATHRSGLIWLWCFFVVPLYGATLVDGACHLEFPLQFEKEQKSKEVKKRRWLRWGEVRSYFVAADRITETSKHHGFFPKSVTIAYSSFYRSSFNSRSLRINFVGYIKTLSRNLSAHRPSSTPKMTSLPTDN